MYVVIYANIWSQIGQSKLFPVGHHYYTPMKLIYTSIKYLYINLYAWPGLKLWIAVVN